MKIREISPDPVLRFRVNHLMGRLEREKANVETLKEQILAFTESFMPQIDILTGMKGISVFITIIAGIIDVSRF
ncbi:MAG: hypothetical protein LBC27_03305 [Spirochaetaceae bacterium]|jgi:hypothetical protein|nr:hypothetical protein [Spirochaetaceae bacterium]